jgi:hypothetical protein
MKLLYRERLIARIQDEKERIEEAVELAVKEANECLARGMEPVSLLANALWVLPIEQLEVVHFAVTPPDLGQFTKSWTTYRNEFERLISSITQPPVPICIESTQVKVFNSANLCWDLYPLQASIPVDAGTRYVWAGIDLVCCGGMS